jgi:hypothetical protein
MRAWTEMLDVSNILAGKRTRGLTPCRPGGRRDCLQRSAVVALWKLPGLRKAWKTGAGRGGRSDFRLAGFPPFPQALGNRWRDFHTFYAQLGIRTDIASGMLSAARPLSP